MSETPVIELAGLGVAFKGKEVLRGFDLKLAPGEKISLVGESSSGKSTLLKAIVGLIKPDRGLVKLFGRDISRLSSRDLWLLRQRVGMQFQSGALFDSMSVMENLRLARRESAKTAQEKARADDLDAPLKLLAQVGLSKAADRPPYALSGGMRKRAALARAITTNPDLAIFDEPTAGLDPVTSRRIIDLIKSVSAQSGAAMILATTDVEVARHFSPKLIILNEGRRWAGGTIDKLQSSDDAFTRKILSRLL